MNCKNCGMALQENDKFCCGCGARVEVEMPAPQQSAEAPAAEQTVEAPAVEQTVEAPAAEQTVEAPIAEPADAWQQPPYAQQSEAPAAKKKGVSKVLIGVIAGVAVAILAVVLIVVGVFSSPSATVLKAVSKSAAAYADAMDSMGLAESADLLQSDEISQSGSVWIDYMEEVEELSGFGVRMTADVSLPDREMALVMTPFMGSADLLTIQAKLEDSEFYMGSPELTGDTFYMIDTESLASDLESMGVDMTGAEDLGFNLFDIAEILEDTEPDEDAMKDLEKSLEKLSKAIEVEKDGSETIEVNGNDVKCKAYNVVIPQDELEDVIDAMEEASDNEQYLDALMEVFGTMGIPDDVLSEMESTMYADTGDSFADVKELLDALGDIELSVYINKGYVMAVIYELEEADAEIILNLGGGKNYVDDLSLRIINSDDDELSITSSGNHAGTKGVYTDETVFELTEFGETVVSMTSEFSYEPKEDSENLFWEFAVYSPEDGSDMVITLEGNLDAGKSSIDLVIDELTLSMYGEDVLVMGMEYGVGKYNSDTVEIEESVTLADLSETELMEAAAEISENGTAWAQDLLEQVPEIANLF